MDGVVRPLDNGRVALISYVLHTVREPYRFISTPASPQVEAAEALRNTSAITFMMMIPT